MIVLGFDIGGTKCAVVIAKMEGDFVKPIAKRVLPTRFDISAEQMIAALCDAADELLAGIQPNKIGISCGGPLDSVSGTILSPPNLPGWNRIEIVSILEKHYSAPAKLLNDANACALAERRFGSGKGTENMVFLTFGTGLGAGIILNGRLYGGCNGNAGEVGHIRLERFGPVGYGKLGSFEGFCSGGGLAKLGNAFAAEAIQNGIRPSYFPEGATEADISAKTLANAAMSGDRTARRVFEIAGEYLGRGCALLIDLLNPELITIGGIFVRCENLLRPNAEAVIREEALLTSASECRIVAAELGEEIGDYGAIAAALEET